MERRFRERKLHRPPPHLKSRRTILVVGEGKETEPNYFHGLRQDPVVRKKFAITPKRGKGGSRLQIVQEAVKQKDQAATKYDETWCVLDVEHPQGDQAQHDLAQAVALAGSHKITLAFSNPSFEVWLLAHFLRTCQRFNDCDAVIVELDKHWKLRFGPAAAYEKSDERTYSKLAGLTSKAIKNAKAVRDHDHGGEKDILKCNSATNVYRLVAKLIS